ncbi:MAG: apolipoprotein N-acyltransferase [Alphaproteobacteria bacterium]|jgi:apolipoprotein N-acyltransferase
MMSKIRPLIVLFLRQYSLFFLIGSVTALSQAPLNFIWASVLGFSAFFYYIMYKKNISLFWAGHCFGFGYFLVGLHWIGNALLTDTAQFAIFLPFAYLGLPFALGFFYAIALWIYGEIRCYLNKKNYHNIFVRFIIFTMILAYMDHARGTIFTGFPWNLPVYTTISMPILMQPSYLLGIYTYNFVWLLLAGSFSFYFLLQKSHWLRLALGHYLFISILAIYGYAHLHTNPISQIHNTEQGKQKKTMLRVIQPNIQQKLKWSPDESRNNFLELLTLSKENLKANYRYIFIWPETALPFNPEYDFAAASQITDLLDNKHSLITGKMRFIEKPAKKGEYDYYNSIFKYTPDGASKAVFDKVHLVPFGEYLPLRFILEKIGFSQINFFKSGFSSGSSFKPFALTDTVTASGLICYEAIFPQYSAIIKKHNANLIINVTNDAWFGDSFGPYQHLVQTQFRAVENNIPIIRSANTGISAYIDKNGLITQSLPINHKGVIDIPLNIFIKHH